MRGPREEAKERAEALAASLGELPDDERERWVLALCAEVLDRDHDDAGAGDPRLASAVVREVVAPVLAARVRERDPDAARWASSLLRRRRCAPSVWEDLLPGATPVSLLEDAARWRPDDPRILEPLVRHYDRTYAYATHELPAGVLYAYDGATAEESAELLDGLDTLEQWVRTLGRADEYADRIAFLRRIVREWEAYRAQSDLLPFEAYLGVHFPEWRDARA